MQLSSYLHFAVDQLLQFDDAHFIQPVHYDTVWAARLTNADGSLAYPESICWLLEQQHPDGSWGCQVPYIHDRLLTTLAVVLLLAHPDLRPRYAIQRQRGERAFWQLAAKLYYDYDEPAGFELLLPTLLAEAKKLELNLPYTQLQRYACEREAKLRLLPMQQLFAMQTTALFSLEAFADWIDLDRVGKLLLPNGSIGASPAATAFLLNQTPDWRARYPQCVAYLDTLLTQHNFAVPHVAPCDLFVRIWTLAFLAYGNLLTGHDEHLLLHYEYLQRHWHPEGVGHSSLHVADADDTAMTLLTLQQAGYTMDGRCLLTYERPEHFACFQYERNPSLSANLHILAALSTLPEADQPRIRDKILGYLLRTRREGAFWSDKWHASVYYPTSRALMILPSYLPEQMAETLRWLLATQHANGAWGQYMPTLEETALVLLALLHYHRHYQTLPQAPLQRAAQYLLTNEQPFVQHYPELWIAKVLYAPPPVIRSCILAALGLYVDTFPHI